MKHAGIQTRYSLRRKEHPHCKFATHTHTQGLQQFIVIDIGKLALAKELRIRFQGGFSCGVCVMLAGSTELDVREIERFYPADTSSLQISFILSVLAVFILYSLRISSFSFTYIQVFSISSYQQYQVYKIVFEKNSDLFGRITVYHLQLYGECTE